MPVGRWIRIQRSPTETADGVRAIRHVVMPSPIMPMMYSSTEPNAPTMTSPS